MCRESSRDPAAWSTENGMCKGPEAALRRVCSLSLLSLPPQDESSMKAELHPSPCPEHVGTNVTELEDGGQHGQNGAAEMGVEGQEAVELDQVGPPETFWLLLQARWRTEGLWAYLAGVGRNVPPAAQWGKLGE